MRLHDRQRAFRRNARIERQQRAVMVLMRMRDDHGAHIVALGFEKADIGQNQIDARQIRSRKGDAAIDDDPLAIVRRAESVHRQIHADFTHAAERHKHKFVHAHSCSCPGAPRAPRHIVEE
jgi:hypothetical protein